MPDPVKGVQLTPPPAHLIPSIRQSIETAFTTLPPNVKGGVFAIVTETGANAAIATRVGKNVKIVGYVGKKWGGEVQGGASAMMTW